MLFGMKISWENAMENSFRHAQYWANVKIIFVKNVFCHLETKKMHLPFCLFPYFAFHQASWTRKQCVHFTQRVRKWVHLPCVLHCTVTDTKQVGCTTCLFKLICAKGWLFQKFLVTEISCQFLSFWGKNICREL